ncbi:MAG: hypothetical protein KAT44_05170, partial [Pirellulales bacterium]|nr:hypothetical protein [Pirellulales bacterium]
MKIKTFFNSWHHLCLLSIALVICSFDALRADPIRKGPKPLKPAEHGIGQLVEAFSFSDINGEKHTMASGQSIQLTVFCFTSTS